MARKPRLNHKAFRQIRTSAGVHYYTKEVAERVAAAAGPGFVVKEGRSINRARYVVVPKTKAAHKANYEQYAVIRALGKVQGAS